MVKYFDYAATCPIDADSLDAYHKVATEFYGNTQSLHDIGSRSASLLKDCREAFASLLGVLTKGIYFTSGGSESNFLAIEALLSANQQKGQHIICSMAEHSSIHNHLERLCNQDNYQVTYLPFNEKGMVDVQALKKVVKEDTTLVIVQHINGEIGTIQPIEEIANLCNEEGILLHSDCVQSFGKVNVKTIASRVDSLSVSSHKIYGPKGVGLVYINPKLKFSPYFNHTSHENGIRPGTINLPGVVGFTVISQKAVNQMEENQQKYKQLRTLLIEELSIMQEQITIYDLSTSTNPAIVGLRFRGIEGQWLMLECNRLGYAISTGSACQVGQQTPSKTMKAMGHTDQQAKEFIRISFGHETTKEDVIKLAKAMIGIAKAYHPSKKEGKL